MTFPIQSTLIRLFWTATFIVQLITSGYTQNLNWTGFVDSIKTYSSPRAVELTGDSVKDFVIGGGVEGNFGNYGVLAFDGLNGNLLWNVPTNDEVFGCAAFQDITGDSIDDVFIGGRYAVFIAINGATGQKLWDFFPYPNSVNPSDSGWYQFYTPQIIPDQNSDGYNDILVTNGGDPNALPWDTNRPPGYVMVLDALNGNILAKAEAPDGHEIYSSPVVVDLKNTGNYSVIFGTGGETIGGGLWSATLQDVMTNDISNAQLLASDTSKGFIAPVSIADLNMDGYLDIVGQSFGGEVHAINGTTMSLLWTLNLPGTESSSEPTIGNFTGGMSPDIFNVFYKGVAPTFTDFYQVLINGQTGQIEWMDSISDLHFASSVAFDYNQDGRDEVFMSTNDFTGTNYQHSIRMIDFSNSSTSIVSSEAGVGLASTPWIGDMNSNGKLDLVYATRKDSINISGNLGFYLKSYDLLIDTSCTDIAWGSYMGTFYDGYYVSPALLCNNLGVGASTTNTSCNGFADGAIYLSPTGGVLPYTYYWEDGSMADSLTGLLAGTYGVTVMDAQCCTKSNTYTINDPYVITINPVHNPCEGDSIGMATVASSGCPCMTSGCLFGWSNGDSTKTATGLGAGMHYITIVHADGCIVIDSVEILAPAIIDSSIVTGIICGGDYGEITLFPHDSSNTNYIWSNGAAGSHLDSLSPGTYTVYVSNNVPCYDTLEFTIDSSNYDTLSLQLDSLSNISCFGASDGYINISANGGMPVYVFNWSNVGNPGDTAINNLTVGAYTIYCVDANGCIDSATHTIYEPSEIIGIYSSISGTCGGTGNATISVSGGTLPYTYNWNDILNQTNSTATDLSSGEYTVTVTDSNGCTMAYTDSVKTTAPITSNIGTSNPTSCGGSNGMAFVSVLTGTGPYAYNWSDSLSQVTDTAFGLVAGTYFVTVLDFAGCDTTLSVTLVDPNSPLLQITDSLQVLCHGDSTGSATVTGFGGTPPYLYSWNSSPVQTSSQAINLPTGTYTVLVTDNAGCSNSIFTSISEPDSSVIITLISINTISILGGSDGAIDIGVSGGVQPFSYSWSPGGEITQDINGLQAGQYQLEVLDANDCMDTLNIVLAEGPVGINNLKFTSHPFNLSPNPNNGTFDVLFTKSIPGNFKLEVLNILGKMLFEKELTEIRHRNLINVQLEDIKKGIYFIRLSNELITFNRKVIVN